MRGGWDRRRWVVSGLAVAALCAVLASSASAVVVHTSSGRFFGVMPRPGVTVSRTGGGALSLSPAVTAVTSTGTLEYHGGAVLHGTRPYLVFWDPTATGIDGATRGLLEQYLAGVAADSARGGNVFGVTRQYSDATGFAASSESWAAGQAIADTQPYPKISANCSRTPPLTTTCLTDAQIQAELERLIAAGGLPGTAGPGAPVYFVLTPANVNVCMTGSECADNYFCAYHTNVHVNGNDLVYAAVPLLNATKGCQSDGTAALQDPNGLPADVAVDNLSHEYNEAITNPDGDAWYDDGSQNEEADYCQQYAATRDPVTGSDPHAYAPTLGTAPDGSLYDQLIAGHEYYTQSEWSNGEADCELAPGAGTLGAELSGPATTRPGVQAVFAPTAISATFGVASATWSFGDGAGAFTRGAPGSQAHAYGAPGTYTATVTLVDGAGQVDTISHAIEVLAPPVAAFASSTGLAPLGPTPVSFDASGSIDPNPGGQITGYRWDFGDGATSTAGPVVSHRYTVSGAFVVRLTVTDIEGDSATVTHPMTVEAMPEVAIRWENAYPVARTAIRLDGSTTPPGATAITAYRWQLGDGASASGPLVRHVFERPGAYRLTLTMTTADGLSATGTRTLHVAPVEALTKLTLTPAAPAAVRLAATVNGPGTLVLAGRRYRLGRPGSVARVLALTTRQITTLRSRRPVRLRVSVVFHPLVGSAIARTARLTLAR
jgi:PKD repeat protein